MRRITSRIAKSLLLTVLLSTSIGAKPTDAELAAITARGKELYEADQAAWHGTDAVMDLKPDVNQWPRYIAHRRDGIWVVSFGKLKENEGHFLVGYEAEKGKDGKFFAKRLNPPRLDTGFTFAAARAIELAQKQFTATAERPHHVAVLPSTEGQLLVYIFPAVLKEGIYPIGGDTQFRISGDGKAVLEQRQLHRAIIERDMKDIPKGAKGVTGYHSHVLSEVPEDTDVLFVLTRQPRIPELIKTPARTYLVDVDGKISTVE